MRRHWIGEDGHVREAGTGQVVRKVRGTACAMEVAAGSR